MPRLVPLELAKENKRNKHEEFVLISLKLTYLSKDEDSIS